MAGALRVAPGSTENRHALRLDPRAPRRLAREPEKAWLGCRAKRLARGPRPSALKHGFYTLDLRKSVIQMGEDVAEYDEHLRRLARVFTPQNPTERRIVRRMGETAWRLLRAYRSMSLRQSRKLRKRLEALVRPRPLTPDQTIRVAFQLLEFLTDEAYLRECVRRLRNQIERLLRMLLVWRTGSDRGFRIYSHIRIRDWSHAFGHVQFEGFYDMRKESKSPAAAAGPTAS